MENMTMGDWMDEGEDGSAVITTEQLTRIRVSDVPDIVVKQDESEMFEITQYNELHDDDMILLTREAAEGLFLVLDTMLHPNEE